MKSKLEKEILDDLCVRRENIEKLFHPPPAKSTFHEWINKGLIVQARGLSGYYLLNKTRVRLGLPPVDVKLARVERLNPQAAKKKSAKKEEPNPVEIRGTPPTLMTVKEAAIYLTVSEQFLRDRIADHTIQFAKAENQIILRRKDLDQYLDHILQRNK
ncbi:helix-turn-helix domain-containing protein [Coraliomargarita algicola]|uniref:Helix-turn-helix domain-containing protein n=1 Tax=Coraliomargarita algicola TaxID=3092156 RepID=A0ABZ0RJA6_9BACT|nr:helix-turn-helix domain-containing protein [Coraliomargarita sp. J2-16]WPJ95256.1 helix-turn-helix domain-containing protein [Coraliomargarita sp. J2-16]